MFIIVTSDGPSIDYFAKNKPNAIYKRFLESGGGGHVISQQDQVREVHCLVRDFAGSDHEVLVLTHSDIVFLFFRVAIREKKLKATEVQFVFVSLDQRIIKLQADEDGRFENLPRGFFDSAEDLLCKLL